MDSSIASNNGIVYGKDIYGSLNVPVSLDDLKTESILILESAHGIFSLAGIIEILLNEYEVNYITKAFRIQTYKGSKLIVQVRYKEELWIFLDRIRDPHGNYKILFNSMEIIVHKFDKLVARYVECAEEMKSNSKIRSSIFAKMIFDDSKSPTENMLDTLKFVEKQKMSDGRSLINSICGISMDMEVHQGKLKPYSYFTLEGSFSKYLLELFRKLWKYSDVANYIIVIIDEQIFTNFIKDGKKSSVLCNDIINKSLISRYTNDQ